MERIKTWRQADVLILLFISLLPKKRKCSITSHTEMYCLRKKKCIHFFFTFFLFFVAFFNVRKQVLGFHHNPPKEKKRKVCFSDPDNLLPHRFFCLFFLKMHKEIRNSQLPFWFHKLIQSHMCYTGLELEHCNLYSWNLLFSIVGYKKEQAT